MARNKALAGAVSRRLSEEVERGVAAQLSCGQLSEFAAHDADAIRRNAERDATTVLRPAFLRDAEKIIHLPFYNRLVGKTQVFSFRANDDLTRRGLHVQLVARVARDIGRALGLNLDLIEAIALGHDIGHTPFGHTGEHYLNDVFHARTGRWFFHNVQSVRVLDGLCKRNLSLQVLDGVICHNGEFEQQRFSVSGLSTFKAFDRDVVAACWRSGNEVIEHLQPMTLEGCVVRISDIIAYVGKDRQDAIRAGICDETTFDDGLGGAYNAWALGAFSADVVENSFGKDHIEMSEPAFLELARAKRENYLKIYGTGEVSGDFSHEMGELFAAMYDRIMSDLMGGNTEAPVFRHHIRFVNGWLGHYGEAYDWSDDLHQTTVDYIASMTDDYFMSYAQHLFPESARLFPKRDHF